MDNEGSYRRKPRYHRLEDRFWRESFLRERCPELTILSIDRYSGPRGLRELMAHPFWEMGCVVKGAIEFICREPLTLQADNVFLIPPGLFHTERSEAPADIIWMALRGNLLLKGSPAAVQFVRSLRLVEMIEQLWKFSEIGETGIGPELDAEAKEILCRYFRVLRINTGADTSDMIERSIAYLHANLSERITIGELADHLGCSQTYFRRVFKRRTGQSPLAYLQTVRLRHGKSLLDHTDMSIAEVARALGYDPFYFSRVFTKAEGMSPRNFRHRDEMR